MIDDAKKPDTETPQPPVVELAQLPRPTFRGIPFPSHEVSLPHAPELAPPRTRR